MSERAEALKSLARRLSDASYTQGIDERRDSISLDRKNDDKVRALLREVSSGIEELVAQSEAAPTGAPNLPEWRPIAEAPKDGTLILACHETLYMPQVVCWAAYHPNATGERCWRTARVCGNKANHVTHWMPLMEAPNAAADGNKENTHE